MTGRWLRAAHGARCGAIGARCLMAEVFDADAWARIFSRRALDRW